MVCKYKNMKKKYFEDVFFIYDNILMFQSFIESFLNYVHRHYFWNLKKKFIILINLE